MVDIKKVGNFKVISLDSMSDVMLFERTVHNGLIKAIGGEKGNAIYNQFMYDYKGKHDVAFHQARSDFEVTNWYLDRANIFARYVQRYYSKPKDGD